MTSLDNNDTVTALKVQLAEVSAKLALAEHMEYVLIGCAMAISSALCLLINLIVIRAILGDKELFRLNSYKFMLALGVVDCTQSMAHFVTGIFTIQQDIPTPWLNQALGVIATPSYVFYAIITLVLALNRLIMIISPNLDNLLFSPFGMKCWFSGSALISGAFALALASPWAAILYSPDQLSWAYDERPATPWVQKAEQLIELGGIPIAGLIYTAIFAFIVYKRQSGKLLRQTSPIAELKILIQAFVITAYCTVLNFFWHNSDWLLPQNKTAYCALNFMWIGNGAINPLIYFVVNAAIRQRVGATFGASIAPAGVPRNGPVSQIVPRMVPLHNNFVDVTKQKIMNHRLSTDQRHIRFGSPPVISHSNNTK